MPLLVTPLDSQGLSYPVPFYGKVDHVVAIDVYLPNLTSFEIDPNGVIKPGVPLTRGGALIGAEATSTPGSAVAGGANVGNGTIGSVSGKAGAPAETITVTFTSATAFTVVGSESGTIGTGVAGTAFNPGGTPIEFTFTAGSTPMAIGDLFTIAVVIGAPGVVFGCVCEASKVANSNSNTDLAAAGTSGTVQVPVVIIGVLRRGVVEDILGRTLTAVEVESFQQAGSTLKLLSY